MAAIFEKFMKSGHGLLKHPGVENFDEIALSSAVKEIGKILCFSILGENLKIQNGRHFGFCSIKGAGILVKGIILKETILKYWL